MDRTDKVGAIIAPSLEAMGYELVRVHMTGSMRPILQIMAERADRAVMTVEDCAEISRAVSALLDVEDPIQEAYTLEVSSPGIDRPLTRLDDFNRFAGFEARVESRVAVEGRKRFRGKLHGTEGREIKIEVEASAEAPEGEAGPAVARVPFDEIVRAKLVLTDELVAASGGHG